jgi:hypothetical protein
VKTIVQEQGQSEAADEQEVRPTGEMETSKNCRRQSKDYVVTKVTRKNLVILELGNL